MNRLERSLALALALGLSAACTRPQDDEGELPGRADDDIEQAANEFVAETRQALNELGEDFQELEATNADLQGESAAAWANTREEIVQARQELEEDMARMERASAAEAEEIHARFADNLETMTHRVERAELLATDGSEELVNAAQRRIDEVDRNIESMQAETVRLPMEVRDGASQEVENLRTEASEVRESVMSLTDAAPQEIEEQREEIAEDVASLWASVRRERFEMQAELDN